MSSFAKETVNNITKGIKQQILPIIDKDIKEYCDKFTDNITDTVNEYYNRIKECNIEIIDIEKRKIEIDKEITHLKNSLNNYEKYFEKLCK